MNAFYWSPQKSVRRQSSFPLDKRKTIPDCVPPSCWDTFVHYAGISHLSIANPWPLRTGMWTGVVSASNVGNVVCLHSAHFFNFMADRRNPRRAIFSVPRLLHFECSSKAFSSTVTSYTVHCQNWLAFWLASSWILSPSINLVCCQSFQFFVLSGTKLVELLQSMFWI